jgi:hypothetical protein
LFASLEDTIARATAGDFISALRAEGAFEIPAGVSRIDPGDLVDFHPVWGDIFQDEG